jgi:hypothetical protein
MNSGFAMFEQALALLKRIDYWLQELTRITAGRSRNALSEGAVPQQTTVGVAATAVLAPNPDRRGLYITNAGATTITLGLGINQPAAGIGLVIPSGQSWNGLLGRMLWDGSISAIGSGAGGLLSVVEA